MLYLFIALTLTVMQLNTVFSFKINSMPVILKSISLKYQTALKMAALEKSPMELSEENAKIVINEIRSELGTIFGYDQASRNVGITGEIEFVDLDGPTISIALKGRFWHATDTVLMRVESFMKQRIPEVIEVVLDANESSIKDDNRLSGENEKKRLF